MKKIFCTYFLLLIFFPAFSQTWGLDNVLPISNCGTQYGAPKYQIKCIKDPTETHDVVTLGYLNSHLGLNICSVVAPLTLTPSFLCSGQQLSISLPSIMNFWRYGNNVTGKDTTIYTTNPLNKKVGIYETSPYKKFQVNGSAGYSHSTGRNIDSLSFLDSLDLKTYGLKSFWGLNGNSETTAGTNFIGTTDDISLIFKTNNIERLRIDSASGNVGVGNPTTLAKLNVVNTNTTIPTLQLYSNTTTYNAGQDLAISVNNANTINNFVVAHNGQVGINTIPDPAFFLDVNGGIHSSTLARINGVGIGTMWGGQPSEISTDHSDTGNDLYLNYTNGGAVGVSTNSVHASAILDCESTTRGFLPPQMTQTQRDAISTPKEGLIIYDLTNHSIDYYDGSAWKKLIGI
jgi:hypothetical protein